MSNINHLNKTIYLPDNSLQKGYFAQFREIYQEIIQNRWLIWQLFRRNLAAIYKQSVLGFLWLFIIPLFSVATFIILNRAGIFKIGEISAPYPVYAILGIAFWQIFASGVVSCSNSLISAGSMISKINFSRKSLVIAAIGQALISFLAQFILVLILFMVYGYTPKIEILFFPLMIIPLIIITLGFGFILSLLNAVIRDIGNLLPMLLTFLMFLTPILYAKPISGLLAAISHYNPVYYLVAVPRDLILTGNVTNLTAYFISIVISVMILFVGLLVFHLTESRIGERI